MARSLETPAGSESMARMGKESSRNLGDPLQSLPQSKVRRPNGPSIGERKPQWESDPSIILGARESCVHGEGMGQKWNVCSRKHLLHTEVG